MLLPPFSNTEAYTHRMIYMLFTSSQCGAEILF